MSIILKKSENRTTIVTEAKILNLIAKKYSIGFDKKFKYYVGKADKNTKGEYIPTFLVHRDSVYMLEYFDGCFNPFLVKCNNKDLVFNKATREPAFFNYPNPKWDTSKYYVN